MQWWFERLDAFPDCFSNAGSGAGDIPREQGLHKSLLQEIDHLLPMVHSGLYLVQPDSLDMQMRAAAHFMRQTYGNFNAPVRIAPPR